VSGNPLRTFEEILMIVVTTPTGAIGGQVLQGLLDRDAPVRVIVRDPSRLPSQVQGRVEVVQGSHGDSDVVTRSLAGADTVFWLVPPDYRTHSIEAAYLDFTRPACEAFTSQGVERVVAVSVLGRGSALADNAGLVTASLAMHDLIAKTGVGYRGAGATLVHGQPPQPGPGDQEPGHVLRRALRRPQAPHLRDP
jgi:uncharacterized protein YbjT (DUF2867 family)